ncbi:MAG: hypothetical protein RL160_207 [Bacteroidota bacterium]|jgi:uncharacterized protein (TIGR02453 family)
MQPTINADFFEFFIGLAQNNRKSWFDEHRTDYEKHVKQPFHQLVAAIQEQLGPPFDAQKTSELIFRINRDIRFSKNKEPYKLHMAAAFAPEGKKDMQHPGFYFQIGVEQCAVYMGIYNPDSVTVERIRRHLANNPAGLKIELEAPAFRRFFGGIQGEVQKRLPADLSKYALQEPLITNKQWYYAYTFEPEALIDADAVSLLMEAYRAGKPMNDFFMQAVR